MRIGVLLVLALATGCNASPPPEPTTAATVLAANATVTGHVDGDTVDVRVRGRTERVRLIGVDTPEVAHAGTPQRPGNTAECYADAAAGFAAVLLPLGAPVRLERDVVGRDDYGRVLAYVYRASDGVFANYELVRQGYAQPLTIPPNVAHTERFVAAARLAEADAAGLWGACG